MIKTILLHHNYSSIKQTNEEKVVNFMKNK